MRCYFNYAARKKRAQDQDKAGQNRRDDKKTSCSAKGNNAFNSNVAKREKTLHLLFVTADMFVLQNKKASDKRM